MTSNTAKSCWGAVAADVAAKVCLVHTEPLQCWTQVLGFALGRLLVIAQHSVLAASLLLPGNKPCSRGSAVLVCAVASAVPTTAAAFSAVDTVEHTIKHNAEDAAKERKIMAQPILS